MSGSAGLLLAFDFGLKRIGVASANLVTRSATPLTTLHSSAAPPWPAIDALIAEWRPERILVGDPGAESGEALGRALEDFVAGLTSRYALAVERVDESFSSTAAADALRAGRREGIYNRRLDKARIDSEAACLIAEQWMNETLERS